MALDYFLLKVGVLLEGGLDLNSREVSLAEGIVLNHDGDGDVVVVLVLMEGVRGGLHYKAGPGGNNPKAPCLAGLPNIIARLDQGKG